MSPPTPDRSEQIKVAAKASFDTLHSGRFMVNVNINDYFKGVISDLLGMSSDLLDDYKKIKIQHPVAKLVVTLTGSWHSTVCLCHTRILIPAARLEPEVAASILANKSNATPLKAVPFAASPQLDWLANWAVLASYYSLADEKDDKLVNTPQSITDILCGLFVNTEVVVVFNLEMETSPSRVAFHSISEAHITDDGKLVPTF